MDVVSDAVAHLIRRLLQASIRGSSNQEDIAANVSQGSAAEPLFKLCGTCEGTGKQQEEYSIGSSSAGGCRVLEVTRPAKAVDKVVHLISHESQSSEPDKHAYRSAPRMLQLMQHCAAAEELSRV